MQEATPPHQFETGQLPGRYRERQTPGASPATDLEPAHIALLEALLRRRRPPTSEAPLPELRLIPELQSRKEIFEAVIRLPRREVPYQQLDHQRHKAVIINPGEDGVDAAEKQAKQLMQQAWWESIFTNKNDNPFVNYPTESYQISQAGEDNKVTLFNFCSPLNARQVDELCQAFELMHQLAGRQLANRLSWIVINNSRETVWASHYGRQVQPFATAFIEQQVMRLDHELIFGPTARNRRNKRFNHDAYGSNADRFSPFQLVLIHEFGHFLDPHNGLFADQLGWRQQNYVCRDGSKHTVFGLAEPASMPESNQLSLPVTEYGYTHPIEDFAESFTRLVVSPGDLEPRRRQALLESLQSPGYPLACQLPRQPNITANRLQGADIIYPRVEIPGELLFSIRPRLGLL